jgi:hypothetical protein
MQQPLEFQFQFHSSQFPPSLPKMVFSLLSLECPSVNLAFLPPRSFDP